MKTKIRVFLISVAFALCFSFLLWPNVSYQNLLFYEIVPAVVASVGHGSLVENKCACYFETLRNSSPSPPSLSRYLSSRQIMNHIDHLRIFLKCQLDHGLNETEALAALADELLPLFSGELPHATKTHDWMPFFLSSANYWARYMSVARGRGIVISIDDANVAHACRLIRVLASLGNELPIQFIHEGDLLARSTATLLNCAKGKQDVEFMDVTPTLKPGYSAIFQGYNNKWFAALFSTFQEIILMDADVVPFVKPSEFFDLEGYESLGAYFFKDRELAETLLDSQYEFFSKMLPNNDMFFNITVDQLKLDNNFFNYKSKHVMESGVVVLRRGPHLLGMIISLALQYWFQSGRIFYGDKDLFWLGQLISGNSNFHFNKHAAAAVGVIEANNTLCSTQLGHFSPDKRLLWINGALNVCKKNTWFLDYLQYPSLRKQFNYSMSELRDNYKTPIEVHHAVLPASIEQLNGNNKTNIRSYFNKNYSRGCGGRYYCASSHDGGEILTFTPKEREQFAHIIDVWNSPL